MERRTLALFAWVLFALGVAQAVPDRPFYEPELPPRGNGIVTTKSGLQWVELKIGEGRTATAGNTVEVHYDGTFKDGKKFDSSVDRGKPFSFPLGAGRVIKGWDEGVAGMKEGGKRKLMIPPEFGYGAGGAPPVIPANAQLIFEVELLKVK
jgi:FKBP-type peptidyl-prolyl cis-trans isomerase